RLRYLREVRFVRVLDHEYITTFGSVERLDDGVADLGDEPLDRFRVARNERSRTDLLGGLLQVELARCAHKGHRVVHHRYASSLEHLAEDHTQWTCPRPLLQIVDRFVSQEQGIEVVHDDSFGVALLDALHEAFERVIFVELCGMSPGQELRIPFPEPYVSNPDVPNLMPALGRGPRQPRRRVLVYLGRDVVHKEGNPHVETSPSYRSVTDAPARSLARRS